MSNSIYNKVHGNNSDELISYSYTRFISDLMPIWVTDVRCTTTVRRNNNNNNGGGTRIEVNEVR